MRSEVAPAPSPPQLAALWLAGAFISLAGFGLVQYVDSLAPWIPGPESVVSGLFQTPSHTLSPTWPSAQSRSWRPDQLERVSSSWPRSAGRC